MRLCSNVKPEIHHLTMSEEWNKALLVLIWGRRGGNRGKMTTEATGIEGAEKGGNCLDQQCAECLTGGWFEVSWYQMAF